MAIPPGNGSNNNRRRYFNRENFTTRVNIRELLDQISHLLTPQQREELLNLERNRGNIHAADELLRIVERDPVMIRRVIEVLPRLSQQRLADQLWLLLPEGERPPAIRRQAVEPAVAINPQSPPRHGSSAAVERPPSPPRQAAEAAGLAAVERLQMPPPTQQRAAEVAPVRSPRRSPRLGRCAVEPTQGVRRAPARIQQPRGDHESIASTSHQQLLPSNQGILLERLRSMADQGNVTVPTMPESVRSRVRSKMETGDTGIKLTMYIRDNINPDELIPYLRDTFPSSVISNIIRTQNRQGEQEAMTMLLDGVYRYDDGLSKFRDALLRSGHKQSHKYFAAILDEARREYIDDEQKIEEAKNGRHRLLNTSRNRSQNNNNRNNNNRNNNDYKRSDSNKRKQPPRTCHKYCDIKRNEISKPCVTPSTVSRDQCGCVVVMILCPHCSYKKFSKHCC